MASLMYDKNYPVERTSIFRDTLTTLQSREVFSAKKNAEHIQVKRCVRAVPIRFRFEPRKPFEEAFRFVRAFLGSSADFQDSSDDLSIVDVEVDETSD